MRAIICTIIIFFILTKVFGQDRNLGYQLSLPKAMFGNNGGRVLNIKTNFDAKGDGVTDDTQAFIDFMTKVADELRSVGWQSSNSPQYILYIPDGTYLVSNTIVYEGLRIKYPDWAGEDILNLRMWGQSRENTIIKLKDNCAGFSGKVYKPVISFCKLEDGTFPNNAGSNVAFSMEVRNLTINTGSGNPAAIGLRYISANSGLVQNLLIKSDDRQGYVGLQLPSWSVQAYISDITIDGFDNGIYTGDHGETNPTFEYITLKNQRVRGIWAYQGAPVIRKLYSVNTVPAIYQSTSNSYIVVLNSCFMGGNSSNAAVELKDAKGKVFLRDVTTSGYSSTVKRNGTITQASGWIKEYVSEAVMSKFPNQDLYSLNMPIEESPVIPYELDLNQWVCVDDQSGANNNEKFKNACATGKPVLYIKSANFSLNGDINIPPTVNRIMGFFANIGDRVGLCVTGNSDTPLLIECMRDYFTVKSKSNRTVILRHISAKYVNETKAGETKVFIESCANMGDNDNFCKPGTNMFIRGINCEHVDGSPQFKVYGGKCVVMGYKSERRQTTWHVTNGGILEALGGYRNRTDGDENYPLLKIEDANAAVIAWTNLGFYNVMASEKRGTVTNNTKATECVVSANGNRFLPLYAGYTISRRPIIKNDTVLVSELQIHPSGSCINIATSLALSATVSPDSATNKAVSWSSDNTSVATVNENSGIVTGISAGKAVITATTIDGSKTDSCQVNVLAPPPSGYHSLKLLADSSWNYIESLKYLNNGIWTTVNYNDAILTTSFTENTDGWLESEIPEAYLHFSFVGTAVQLIGRTSTNGGIGKIYIDGVYQQDLNFKNTYTKDSLIYEKTFIPITGITISPNENSVFEFSTTQLKINFTPKNASNQNVNWHSNATKVAIVNENGLVTGVSDGIATITTTTEDGEKTATSTFIVNKKKPVTWTEIDDKDSNWKWNGYGQDPCTSCYNGSAHSSNVKGTYGEINFSGTEIEAYCETFDDGGDVEIFIDGTSKGLFSQKVEPYGGANIFASIKGLSNSQHTVKFVSTSTNWTGIDYIRIPADTTPPFGSLTGSVTINTSSVDLSNNTADWKHFRNNNHKAVGTKINSISNYSSIGGIASYYSDGMRKISWTDGAPHTTETNNTKGLSIPGTGKGFSFTVNAEDDVDTLKIYVSGNNSGGVLIAHLSNFAATDYVDEIELTTGAWDAVYTIIYHAKEAGQTLKVNWLQTSGTGSIGLQAASISGKTFTSTGNLIGQSSSIQVYPNPASDFVTIDLGNGFSQNAQTRVRIVDLLGKQISLSEIDSQTLITNINTSQFAKGIYIVTVVRGTERAFKKLVIE